MKSKEFVSLKLFQGTQNSHDCVDNPSLELGYIGRCLTIFVSLNLIQVPQNSHDCVNNPSLKLGQIGRCLTIFVSLNS
ncbi:hypothetical protein, partial [Pseudoalteromonas citrea]|uniref:hypothetical protein n=1 Tax=Pseudoalteromonas citrea TaxID=43655 RepID=UPI001BB1B8E0